MNKRVTIEMPEEMARLVEAYAAEAGAKPDAYLLDLIEQHLEDLHDIAAADARWNGCSAAKRAPIASTKWCANLAWTIEFEDWPKNSSRSSTDKRPSALSTTLPIVSPDTQIPDSWVRR